MKISTLARPPIMPNEIERAEAAICPHHDGLIAYRPGAADKPGRVYFCPVGREYWRLAAGQRDGFTSPLRYPKGEIV